MAKTRGGHPLRGFRLGVSSLRQEDITRFLPFIRPCLLDWQAR